MVEREYPLRRIRRDQTARQAVDDVLIERLEIGDLGRLLSQADIRRAQALRKRSAEPGDRKKAEHVQATVNAAAPCAGNASSRVAGHSSASSCRSPKYCRSTRPT